MRLSLLRAIDQRFGLFLLYLFALPVRLLASVLPAPHRKPPRFIFLKLKGGGSLIIAMPSLLGLRRAYADAEFVLVCTAEARIYAELTGIFDRYVMIDDGSVASLLFSGLRALLISFRTSFCVDLEPNSMLAALFTLLTCAARRIGLVRPEQTSRGLAYTSAVSFNSVAPIYVYYDQLCKIMGGHPAPSQACRDFVRGLLPPPKLAPVAIKTIGIIAFTSDFARERMMPPATWAELLRRAFREPIRLVIFGSARNREAADEMVAVLQRVLPGVAIENLAGSGTLAEAAAQLAACNEVWAVDSGLLHIVRLLGVPSRSFWGPTMPAQRLRPITGLAEQTIYRPFLCSPCIQASTIPACGGNNLCMISMAEDSPDLSPSWVTQ